MYRGGIIPCRFWRFGNTRFNFNIIASNYIGAVDGAHLRLFLLRLIIHAHEIESGDLNFGLLRLDVKDLRAQLETVEQELVLFQREVNSGQLGFQLLEVPIAVFAGLVVHQPEQVDLLLGQFVRDDTRDRLNPHLPASPHTGVAAYDGVVHVHNDGEQEAETLNAVFYLLDGEVIVARVVLIFPQPRSRNLSDIHSSLPPVRNRTNPR